MTENKKIYILNLLNSYKLCGMNYIEPLNLNKIDKNKNDLPNDFNGLENYVNHCSICELSKFKSDSIFSLGEINSDIMIVGTNCDFLNENIYKLLENIIKNVLLIDFNKVYITNILKCSTKTNIKSIKQSIELCSGYLTKQIELVKPKFIITLGTAFNHLLCNDDNVLDISGNIYEYNGIKTIPLLDLEFIYKNPSYKQDMFNDLKKIKSILE